MAVGLQADEEVEPPLRVNWRGGEHGVRDVDHGRVPPGVVAGFRVVELVENDDALELADGGAEDGGGRCVECWRGQGAILG